MRKIVSVSWGKDSTAMLIWLIENDYPIDEIIFYDTGMEFDAIYKTRDYVLKNWCNGIKYTELKPKEPFIYKMIIYPHKTRKGFMKYGYGWCGGMCRWGTTEKTKTIDTYLKNNYGDDYVTYVGIAYDEPQRLKHNTYKRYPLYYVARMTEEECLEFCYNRNITFGGLYKYLKRVSCWCCRNKNLKELKNYKKYLPEYYKRLKTLEYLIGEPMKPPYTLYERFEKDGEEDAKKTNESTL